MAVLQQVAAGGWERGGACEAELAVHGSTEQWEHREGGKKMNRGSCLISRVLAAGVVEGAAVAWDAIGR